MIGMRRAAAIVILAFTMLAPAAPAAGGMHGDQPQPPQEEFVPIDQVPPEDQLPAAPLLIAAYAVVWLIVFGYLWSLWRRQSAVEQEMRELSRRADAGEQGT